MSFKPKESCDTPASDLFASSFCDTGSPVADCELCGRTNFDFSGEFMEEGELETLLAKQEKQPEKYHGQNNTISWGHINGRQFVWDCPCNLLYRWEQFVWTHRFSIAIYLKKRAEQELKTAQMQHDQIKVVPTL